MAVAVILALVLGICRYCRQQYELSKMNHFSLPKLANLARVCGVHNKVCIRSAGGQSAFAARDLACGYYAYGVCVCGGRWGSRYSSVPAAVTPPRGGCRTVHGRCSHQIWVSGTGLASGRQLWTFGSAPALSLNRLRNGRNRGVTRHLRPTQACTFGNKVGGQRDYPK